jgi:hypothetical protein
MFSGISIESDPMILGISIESDPIDPIESDPIDPLLILYWSLWILIRC